MPTRSWQRDLNIAEAQSNEAVEHVGARGHRTAASVPLVPSPQPITPIDLDALITKTMADESLTSQNAVIDVVTRAIVARIGRPLSRFEAGRLGMVVALLWNARECERLEFELKAGAQ